MTPERWQQINAIFAAAVARDGSERATYLDEVCAGDPALRRQVEALLISHEQAPSFLEAPILEGAAKTVLSDAAESMVGRRLGAYKIVREIGRGGMGAVYLAERDDAQFRKQVAIKLVKRGMDTDAILRRFRQEQQILADLDHPNIARLLDGGTTEDGLSYFIMEYVEGLPIDVYCDTHKLPIDERLKLFRTVCSAVEYAHQSHVVHRDLKPRNILVTASGVPKLLDFGIAKVLDLERLSPMADSLVAGRPMTPEYASPEQVRGEAITPRSDVYSLGVLLYELLTGHQPYRLKTGTPEELVRILREEEPERPSTAMSRIEEISSGDGGVPLTVTPESVSQSRAGSPEQLRRRLAGDLDNIVLTALRKEPERRYASVEQFSEDIRRHLEGRPVLARKDTVWYRSGKFLRRNQAGVIAAACFMVLLLALIGVGLHLLARRDAAQAQAIDSLAVLPLANVSIDPETEYLSDGLTEQLIHSLSQMSGLKKVIAYSSVQRFKSPSPDPQRAAQQLGVRAVATGRVLLRGDEISITLELVDARDQRRLWGEQYRRKLADLGTMPEGIARDLAENLQRQLRHAEMRRQTPRGTENSEAYQLYLRGRYLLSKRTNESLTRSIEYFERAIEKDPDLALAYAALADCYARISAYTDIPPRESYPKARAAALKALALDERLGEAHAVLASYYRVMEWNWSAAERELRRALELSPNHVNVREGYAGYLANLGRHEEAIAEVKRALELDPFSVPLNRNVGRMYFCARQYDRAIKHLQGSLELDPNYPSTHGYLSWAYEQKGLYDEAVAERLKADRLAGARPEEIAALQEAYAASGITGLWRKQLALTKEKPRRTFSMARIYAKLGEAGQAFAWLESAYAEHEAELVWLKADPQFDNLHSDPRWADLLRRLGLPP